MLFSDRLLDPLMKRGVGFMAEYTTNHIAKGLEKRQESGGEDKDFPTGIFIAVVATIFVFVVSYGLVRLPSCPFEVALLTVVDRVHSSPRRHHIGLG